MERENIGDQIAEEVIGGTIVFNPDHTTCGLNNNSQFKVNDFNGALKYISDHKMTMTERDMLKNMLAQGLIARL